PTYIYTLSLHDALPISGHKGIIFATTSFQSGAIEYAQKHGIALIHFADASTTIIAKRDGVKPKLPMNRSPYVGWLVQWEEIHERSEEHTSELQSLAYLV